MLKKGRYFIFILLFITSCTNRVKNEDEINLEVLIKNKSEEILGEKGYTILYEAMADTLKKWMGNDLYKVNEYGYEYKIDSLYCINTDKNKIIGNQIHFNGFQEKNYADGIQEFYGVKINENWYFWVGGYTPLIREGVKGHDKRYPLSYQQLHKVAVSTLSGYLDEKGNIRDSWFEAKFKNGYYSFKDRYKYKSIVNGEKIDIEEKYWEYIWRKKGTQLWISKFSNDSISKKELSIGRELTTEEKKEIYLTFSKKTLNQPTSSEL